MLDRATESNAETLLQQIEEGLKRSREIIAQIDKLLVQRSQLRWRLSGFSGCIPFCAKAEHPKTNNVRSLR